MNIFNSVFVDCTASADIASLYKDFLQHNISVVAANKIAASSAYENYRELKTIARQRGVKYLFETNVGAGLPIINTINDLIHSGDKILKIEAVLSGTLNYIFNKISADIPFSGRVVILGCGGVARTMAYEAVLADNDLTLAVRKDDVNMANDLKKELESIKETEVKVCLLDELSGEIDVLVNATPVGMFPKVDNCPVNDEIIKNSNAVFDAIYNPLETQLVQKAKAFGNKAIGGMAMLVWQAVVAQQKWNDVTFNKDDINKLCIDCLEELKNK